LTNPVTANVWAEHSVWPQDPQIPRALAGGLTTMQVLPGSGNLIGGRSVVVKLVPSRTVQGMKFPGAKYGLKMACGENPKRVYQTRGPSTRMVTSLATARRGFKRKVIDANGTRGMRRTKAIRRRVTLVWKLSLKFLRGNILVHNHCYRADEMAQMIDIAKEFGYSIRAFHHSVEAYKIADLLKLTTLARLNGPTGAGSEKRTDAVKANLAITEAFGARAMIHSDSALGAHG